jgi:hypothetical protein
MSTSSDAALSSALWVHAGTGTTRTAWENMETSDNKVFMTCDASVGASVGFDLGI